LEVSLKSMTPDVMRLQPMEFAFSVPNPWIESPAANNFVASPFPTLK